MLRLAFAGLGTVLAGHANAQSVFPQFGDPDSLVAPLYRDTVPNGGIPDAGIHVITGFDRTFGYGSSSTNTRRADIGVNGPVSGVSTEVNSNGHAIYIELFSPAIGAYNGRGSDFTTATNLADGGSTSTTALTGSPGGCTLNTAPNGQPKNGTCTLQPQVVQFQTQFGQYRPGDIAVQWSGINDINVSNINTQARVDSIVSTNVTMQTKMVEENIALGARNYVFVGLADLGTFANFTINKPTNIPALVTEAAMRTNAGMMENLIRIHQETGANIHYFDSDRFVSQIRANPTAYGFTAEGVAPNVYGTASVANGGLGSSAAFVAAPFSVQNQYLTQDGLHWTYRYHAWMAAAIANQLLAPYTLAAQADLVDASGQAFSNSVLRRLQDNRTRSAISSVMDNGVPAKDAPGRLGPLTFYAEGLYAGGDRADRFGGAGIGFNISGVTFGADYRASPNLMLGVAFNYSNPTADVNHGWGQLSADAYQVAAYGSWTTRNWFFDIAASGGFSDLDIERGGLVSNISGTTNAESFVAQAKTGYLFDVGTFSTGSPGSFSLKVGPIAGVSYSHTRIDGYTEAGDPMLTQWIDDQTTEGLTGRIGIELRGAYRLGGSIISPWLDVTLERDFEDGARVLTTAQTYALPLTIATAVSNPTDTYGRVAGGVSAQVSQNVFLNLSGEATFGREDSNDYAFTGGLKITW